MIRFSEGSFDFSTIYNLPIHLREYYLTLMIKEVKQKNKSPNEMTLEDVSAGKIFNKPKELPIGTWNARKAT
jgi:hypothetical protein